MSQIGGLVHSAVLCAVVNWFVLSPDVKSAPVCSGAATSWTGADNVLVTLVILYVPE